MKLFQALQESPVQTATRLLTDGAGREGREPNIALMDGELVKAFRAVEDVAWGRRPLREAKKLSDWTPATDRRVPVLPVSRDPNDYRRASGHMVCTCGKPYRDHPHDDENLGYDDAPFLRVLCSGDRVKL